jgi:hypothetical protein
MTKKFLCGSDYLHEMAMGWAMFYDTLEECKNDKECWGECGIVELQLDESGNEVSHIWVVKEDLGD